MDMSEKHFISTVKLSLASQVPMYMQLVNYFKKQIKSGKIKPKDKLINEVDIVKLLGISRTTVRLAFDYLENEGFIIRKRGKGSYVAEQNIKRHPGCLYNLKEKLKEKTISIIDKQVRAANDVVKSKLKLSDENGNVFCLRQIISYNGTPVIDEMIYIPQNLCSGIENSMIINNSLFQTLQERYNIKIEKTEETVESISIGENIAQNLQCQPNTLGFRLESVSKLKSGIPCIYEVCVVDAQKFRLKINSERNKNDNILFELINL
ncbi:MAG: GntR family transcriptional regulator [Candidatus Gastranaerophilaceae bacterium]